MIGNPHLLSGGGKEYEGGGGRRGGGELKDRRVRIK